MKISILVSDISGNCYGRAYILAQALKQRYEVEIVGSIDERGVWPPCDTNEFVLKTTRTRRHYPGFVKSAVEILSHISGDVVYAMKPRPSSFGFGLLKKLFTGRPVVLDIDDWEEGCLREYSAHRSKSRFRGVSLPYSYSYVVLMERMVKWADQITTVSDFFLKLYGRGTKVPHGRDVHWLDPSRYDREALRGKWSLRDYKVILWLGTMRPHKGIEDLARAVTLLDRSEVRLLLVGATDVESLPEDLKEVAGRFTTIVGVRPFSELPLFLSMADLVVLPQRNTLTTMGQIPAKLFDAMAMGRPVISTSVSDIPRILDGCGVVVEPGNVEQIAEAIGRVLDDEEWAAELGRLAREKCIREYSIEVMERTLATVFDRYVSGRVHRS